MEKEETELEIITEISTMRECNQRVVWNFGTREILLLKSIREYISNDNILIHKSASRRHIGYVNSIPRRNFNDVSNILILISSSSFEIFTGINNSSLFIILE